MKKKLLITLAIVMGGVIAIVIAQTDAELSQMFDSREMRDVPLPQARVGQDIDERRAAAEYNAQQFKTLEEYQQAVQSGRAK